MHSRPLTVIGDEQQPNGRHVQAPDREQARGQRAARVLPPEAVQPGGQQVEDQPPAAALPLWRRDAAQVALQSTYAICNCWAPSHNAMV